MKDIYGEMNLIPTFDDQIVNYTSFDKVSDITCGNSKMTYEYGAGRQRVKAQTYVSSTLTSTKYYAGGGIYEKEIDETTGEYEEIHYISGGGGVVAICTKESSTGNFDTRYLFKDPLGSVYCYTDEDGSSPLYLSFDAWGNRRDPDNWAALYPGGDIPTLRGFTGHEHMDLFRLVNMNGRIYDPTIGRFLSADPIVQIPDNLQGLNRYSYCLNNPLVFTDPSGYLSEDATQIITSIASITVSALTGGLLNHTAMNHMLVTIISSATGGFAGGFTGSMLSGGDVTQSLKDGAINSLWSMSSALGNNLVGNTFRNSTVMKACTHGLVQGGISQMRGQGFRPAFLASFATGTMENSYRGYGKASQLFASAMIGGTSSVIGGGKFANGAVTGAYQVMFNSWAHEKLAPASQRLLALYLRNSKMIRVPGMMQKIPNPFFMAEAITRDFGFTLSGGSYLASIEGDVGWVFVLAGRDRGRFRLLDEGAAGAATDIGIGGEVSRVDYLGNMSNFAISELEGPRHKVYGGVPIPKMPLASVGFAYTWSNTTSGGKVVGYVLQASLGVSLSKYFYVGYNYGRINIW